MDHLSGANMHHDIPDLDFHGEVTYTKKSKSQEQNIAFLRKKEILDVFLQWQT